MTINYMKTVFVVTPRLCYANISSYCIIISHKPVDFTITVFFFVFFLLSNKYTTDSYQLIFMPIDI